MGHFWDGEAGKIFVKMYKGRAIGMSFPTDENRHYDTWTKRKYPVIIEGKETQIVINTYEDGTLIHIEMEIPESIQNLETGVS